MLSARLQNNVQQTCWNQDLTNLKEKKRAVSLLKPAMLLHLLQRNCFKLLLSRTTTRLFITRPGISLMFIAVYKKADDKSDETTSSKSVHTL